MPIGAVDDALESCIKKNATTRKTEPEAFDSHLVYKCKVKSDWESNNVVAD